MGLGTHGGREFPDVGGDGVRGVLESEGNVLAPHVQEADEQKTHSDE